MAASNGILDGSTASASSVYSGSYTAAKTIDGSASTFWASADGAGPWWIKFDLGVGVTKTGKSYKIKARATNYHHWIDWTLQVSNNDSDYLTVDTQTSQDFTNGEEKSYNFSMVGAYRYWKFVITTTEAGNNGAEAAELTVIEDAGVRTLDLGVVGRGVRKFNRRSPVPRSPVLCMNFEGSDEATTFQVDGKWKDVTVSYAGEARIDTAQYIRGLSSVEFDWNQNSTKNSDYIKLAAVPNFTLKNYTISFYVRLRWIRNYQIILQVNASYIYSPCLVVDSTSMRFTYSYNNLSIALASPASLNVWYKIDQIVLDKKSYVYLNNKLVSQNANYSSGISDATLDLYLAYGGPNSDNYPYSGWMDNLKIYDYAKNVLF